MNIARPHPTTKRRPRDDRRGSTLRCLLAALCALVIADGIDVRAQDQVRDFTRPILVLNSGGHHAPVRSLVFTPDGGQLLSGGFDKVVNVWGLKRSRPALEATLRPPIWRGPAGRIYAMALSPTADERGRRVLAVAGYGVGLSHGNIGLFYYPGSNAIATGDYFAELLNDDPDAGLAAEDRPTGHADTVTSLAFDPGGTLLASASNDATVRIWDWKARRTTAILRGHAGPVNALAFAPDGFHLISGGRDGTLRLWDVRRPQGPTASAPPPPPRNANDPLGLQINALDLSRDGRWAVIGREDGLVIRHDAATLANPLVLSSEVEAIEALALSHSGARLVTSSIGRPRTASELPRLDCTIRVRNFPGGEDPRVIRTLDNNAHACRFSPDDLTLAVAGGDDQAIYLFANWWDEKAMKVQVLKGQGRSIWDVGLRTGPGGLAIGFSHDPDQNEGYVPRRGPAGAGAGARYDGMVLPGREVTSFDSADLSRGLRTFDGWTVRPIDQYRLEVVRDGPPRRTIAIVLDEVKDRRWKCYSFIPPGPDHPSATLAVGCESGVWFYRLDDGRPTRLFSGHSGPVYCLSPSKDGRWLATGSSDQTVCLWTLARCDVPPTLGVEFGRRPDGSRVVTSVERLGFGEAMGLRPGDVPRQFGIGKDRLEADDFFDRYESQLPNTPIQMIVRRKIEPTTTRAGAGPAEEDVGVVSTKRDGPAVSLFLGATREWVLWMPSGYYDTSIAGDLKFLGWHLNQSTIFKPRPTDYLEIIKFEKELRQPRRSQPNKLDTLLLTGDRTIALDVPFPPVRPVVPRPDAPERRLDVARDAAPAPLLIRTPRPPVANATSVAIANAANVTPTPRPAVPTAADPLPATLPAPAPAPADLPPVGPLAATPVVRPSVPATGGRIDNRPRAGTTPIGPPASPPLPPASARPPMPATPDVRLASPSPTPTTNANANAAVPDIPRAPAPEVPGVLGGSPPLIARVPDRLPPDVPGPGPGGPTVSPLVFHHTPAEERLLASLSPLLPTPPGPLPVPAPDAATRRLEPALPTPSPAEIVERGQPPAIEPRIEPLPGQRITTPNGKPIDPREVPPEKIAVDGPALDADGRGTLVFDLKIDAEGRSPARSVEYRVDGRPIRPGTVFDPPVPRHREFVKLAVAPGPHRFTVEVVNAQGIGRTMSRDILVQGPPRTRPGRLKILTIAPAFAHRERIPKLPHAERDARDLRAFFHKYLVSPLDGGPLYSIDEDPREGDTDTSDRVAKAFEALKDEPLAEEDLVVVVIESHFLHVRGERSIAAADSRGIPPSPAIDADDLARHLGDVARRKCRVLALIDGVHTASGKNWDNDLGDWVRHLRDEQNVIAFVASNSGPSRGLKDRGHQAFAQAVLDSVRPPILKDGPYLLDDFRDVVVERVLELTRRQQQAECYVPEAIGGMFPLLNPQPTGR